MRYKKFLLSILFALFCLFPFSLKSDEIPSKNNIETKIRERSIIILPFFNYSHSELKYLSTYIPELISNDISRYEGINVLFPGEVKKDIESGVISSENFFYDNKSIDYLQKRKVDVALAGRYIIQGNSIRIDFKVINVKDGTIENSNDFEGFMDEHLLSTLDRYSKISADWIVEHVISGLIQKIDTKYKTRSEKYIEKIRRSKAGQFVTNKWIFAAIIVVFFYFIGKFISYTFKRTFPKIKGLAHNRLDEKAARKFRKTLKRITILFGLKLSILSLGLSPVVYDTLNDIITAIIMTFFAYAFIIFIEATLNVWGGDVTNRINPRVNRDLMPLFVTFTKIFITSIVIILILSRFDIDIGPFIASIGIMGIAIGFAVKDSLADIIGGIFLALDHSIAAGDMVTIDGDTGYVKEVGIRNTKLLTFDNEVIVIPNGELSNKKFKNFVLPDPSFRIVINFSIAYGTDVDNVEEVVLAAIKTMEDISSVPEPICIFEEMADFALIFQAKFWIPNYNIRLYKKKEATRIIYKALNNADIPIPFPTHTVYIKNGN